MSREQLVERGPELDGEGSKRVYVAVIGGTSGIGLEIARAYASEGAQVILSGRNAGRAEAVARTLGPTARGIEVELARPEQIARALVNIDRVDHLVLAAVERDENTVRDYDIDRAIRLVTQKLVGYTEVVHALISAFMPEASILLLGGLAKERPYPGSTTITTVNGAVASLVRTLAVELAPIRVNALHPGIVGDTPAWSDKSADMLEQVRSRTPTGRLVETQDVVHAARFLLENRSVNGVNLEIDGGWLVG